MNVGLIFILTVVMSIVLTCALSDWYDDGDGW